MFAKFTPTLAANVKPGDLLLEPGLDGTFAVYTVETAEMKPRKFGNVRVERIRFGFAGDRYRYAIPADMLPVAANSLPDGLALESLNDDEAKGL